MRTMLLATSLIILGWTASPAVIAEFAPVVVDPEPLNNHAATDSASDSTAQVSADGLGTWIAVWYSGESAIGGGIGTDVDILIARSTDNGASWSSPQALNTNAGTDTGTDVSPQFMSDGSGNWVAVWESSTADIGEGIGFDTDILFARSSDNGVSWSPPEPLNSNAGTDSGEDWTPALTTDGSGNWVAAWRSYETAIGGGIGGDADVLFVRSTDNGVSWSPPEPLNSFAGTDDQLDAEVQVATDGAGTWIAVWGSQHPDIGGGIGTDMDILFVRSTDNGASWTPPQTLNTTAGTDGSVDFQVHFTTDGTGTWVAAWSSSNAAIGSGIGTDRDILVAHSTDHGASWSTPQALNTNAGTDSGGDYSPHLTMDRSGNWIAVWRSLEAEIGGGIGTDRDILIAHSGDNGASWSPPGPLNTNAVTDTGADHSPQLATNGAGIWLAVWTSSEPAIGGGIGTDSDILVARFSFCPAFVRRNAYGRLLFPPLCTRDASELNESLYDSATTRINRGPNDVFYLSSAGMSFAPLVVDDAVHIEGQESGFGPYTYQPPYSAGSGLPLRVPIETVLVPQMADDQDPAPDLIPTGSNQVLFELLNTQPDLYGNTALYLVRDCGIWTDVGSGGQTLLNWISYAVEVDEQQSNLDVASGVLSDLRVDRDFSNACSLGTFIDTAQAVDARADPPAGDGFYYVVSGTCAQPIGYGNSSAGPRTELPGLPPVASCP